jgi:D-amino peptidase
MLPFAGRKRQAMPNSSSQPAVFVSVDMEGCADIVHWDEVRPSPSLEYARSCAVMTDEVNAVVAGAFDGGAASVTVNDSHSTMRNLIAERLDSRATIVSGRLKPLFMLQGIGREHTAAFFIGYHGAIGDAEAVLGHTYSPRVIFECRLNGAPVGELTINAALAGSFGVPVTLVSGDRTTVAEAEASVPWAERVETKRSFTYYAAQSYSPAKVCEMLREAASLACGAGNAKPFELAAPVTMEIDTFRSAQADHLELMPGISRVGARTIAFTASDFGSVYRALQAAIYLGSAATA